MGYKCLFMDDSIYTAQDVNDAISGIISGGVSNYPLGIDAISDLNSAIAQMIGGGVQFMDTSCLVVNDGGTYKISAGACFMNDGSQIVFDEDGYGINHTPNKYEYVYLERDVLHNRINVVVSEESGGEGTVPLAEIDYYGTVFDRRRFAKAKISLTAEPQNIGVTKNITREQGTYGDFDIDVGFNGWKYIVYELTNSRGYADMGCLEFPDGSSTRCFPFRNTDGAYDGSMIVTRNGSVLHFENPYGTEFDIDFEVR